MFRLKLLERLFDSAKPSADKELLTDEMVCKLLNDYTDSVVLYNFDTRKWNRDYYLWRRIMSSGVDCSALKQEFERNYPETELAAVVGMAVVSSGDCLAIVAPRPAMPQDANCLAYATLIVRDRNTGNLCKPKCWIRLSNCPHPAFVAEAMPQLLSGIGRTTAHMSNVGQCFKEKVLAPAVINKGKYIHYQKMLRKQIKQTKKNRYK